MGRRAKYLTQKAKNKSKYKFEIKKKQLEKKLNGKKSLTKEEQTKL